MELKTVRSQRWGYARIIVGTIAGGMLGFYVMHRLELSYKAKWDERLKKYEEEKMKKKVEEEDFVDVKVVDDFAYFDDDASKSSHRSN
ncbi:hypothetical protein vseg_020641 [Gypsophila vaccaria]